MNPVSKISVTGNANGVSEIMESRYFVKADQLYVSDIDRLSGRKWTTDTSDSCDDLSSEVKNQAYGKVYAIRKNAQELFDKGVFNQFFSITGGDPVSTTVYFNGENEVHVGVRYYYSTGKIVIGVPRRFAQIDVLRRLFQTADFSFAGN